MNNQMMLRMICEESGMDYSRLSEQDKQTVQEYLAAYPTIAQSSESSAYSGLQMNEEEAAKGRAIW